MEKARRGETIKEGVQIKLPTQNEEMQTQEDVVVWSTSLHEGERNFREPTRGVETENAEHTDINKKKL